jgi:aryl-alcohol dehydrogenase-like predicted oxidoreductase
LIPPRRAAQDSLGRLERSGIHTYNEHGISSVRTEIAPGYDISRIIKGGWQLAGDHGAIDRNQAVVDMATFVESGITTFDCADIYTDVEVLIGSFRARYPELAGRLQVHTKFVPDLSALENVDSGYIERGIDRSLRRLGLERLDLVQFHWWDYSVPGYVEAALELERLRRAGKIAHIGLTNFDVPRTREILQAGVPVISMQMQYSVLDERPHNGMLDLCRAHGIAVICYGTVAGGFLSERWLGRPEPGAELHNRSLIKYQLIIEDFGGWELFQSLLRALEGIAIRHRCDIASVASKLLLDRPEVAAVIIGATNAAHLAAHRRLLALPLDAEDKAAVQRVLKARSGPLGDIYDLERDRSGRHGRIMKYDLNR